MLPSGRKEAPPARSSGADAAGVGDTAEDVEEGMIEDTGKKMGGALFHEGPGGYFKHSFKVHFVARLWESSVRLGRAFSPSPWVAEARAWASESAAGASECWLCLY